MFSVRHNLYKKASLEALALPLRRRVLQVLARVLAFLSILSHFEAPPKKSSARPPRGTLRLLWDFCRCWQEP